MSKRWDKTVAIVAALAVVVLIGGGLFLYIRPYLQSPARRSHTAAPTVAARADLGPWGREEVVRWAARLEPADVSERTIMPPPLELTRQSAETKGTDLSSGVRIVTGFECSVPLNIRKLSDSHFVLQIETPGLRNWFMFRVEGIPAGGKTVRIDLDRVNLGKWRSLNPVYSYCQSLSDLSAFEAKSGSAKPVAAYNGPLLPDTSGQQWHYIPAVWSQGSDRLCFVQHFDHDAYIAMRVPYTPSYNDAYLASLSNNPFAKMITLGHSPQGRLLQLVKISAGKEAEHKNPCIVLYAAEQPDQPDSNWAVQGAIRFLVSDDSQAARLRERLTFLLLPVYDPDGSAEGVYDRISQQFIPMNPPPEVVAYANWFQKWVESGKRLDVALDLLNMESAEMGHLGCFYSDGARLPASREIHSAILKQFGGGSGNPYFVAQAVGRGAYLTNRLGGWLEYYYGPLCMLYEMNSQEKHLHLALAEEQDFGRRLVLAMEDMLSSDGGRDFLAQMDRLRQSRSQSLAQRPAPVGPNAIMTEPSRGWTIIDAMKHEAARVARARNPAGESQR